MTDVQFAVEILCHEILQSICEISLSQVKFFHKLPNYCQTCFFVEKI